MILKIFCIKLNILKYIYLSIKYFFKDLKLHLVLKTVKWINLVQSSTKVVVHKQFFRKSHCFTYIVARPWYNGVAFKTETKFLWISIIFKALLCVVWHEK
jgi:hypothetical protein